MRIKRLLRIASILLIIHVMGHTFGHLGWKNAKEPEKQEVIHQMTGHKFPFMGEERSMGDYFEGYGWACSIALILMAILLWIISGAFSENKHLCRKIALALMCSLFAWCLVEFLFFFPFAACTTLLAAILTLIACIPLKDRSLLRET